jgi:putative restriction endonuclease
MTWPIRQCRGIFAAVLRLTLRAVVELDFSQPWHRSGPVFGDPRLALRSDVHTLFDRGYLAVDQEHRLLVSPRLRADFNNGDQFYAKAGQLIDLPERCTDRPGREFLEWHLDEVFLKAAAT